jgi:hypothetical protein
MTTNHLKALAKNRKYHLDSAAQMDQKIKKLCHHPPQFVTTIGITGYEAKICTLCNTRIEEATDGNP